MSSKDRRNLQLYRDVYSPGRQVCAFLCPHQIPYSLIDDYCFARLEVARAEATGNEIRCPVAAASSLGLLLRLAIGSTPRAPLGLVGL